MKNNNPIVSDHLDGIADQLLDEWFQSQRYDMEAKERTQTLRNVVISAYIMGVLDSIQAVRHGVQGKANNIVVLEQLFKDNEQTS
jgi:hypothetical protein